MKVNETIEQHWIAYLIFWFAVGMLLGNFVAQIF